MPNNQPDRFLRLLGLAKRGGKTVAGAPLIFAAMHKGRPPALVIAAADASEGSAKKIGTQCEYYRVPLLRSPYPREVLSHAVGEGGLVAAVAVCDPGLAEELIKSSGKDASLLLGSEEK